MTAVAVYVRDFLPVSMTFVYRQLLGVRGAFDPIVLASGVANRELFPFDPVYAHPIGLDEKVARYVKRRTRRSFVHIAPRRLRAWERALRKHDARLLHVHFGNRALEVLPLARRLGLPLLVTFHGMDASSLLRDPVYRAGLKDLFAYAKVLAVSDTMARRLEAEGAADVAVHHVGIPLDAFPYVARTRKPAVEWLQVSNFVEKKGHVYTVEAFHRLGHADSRLTLAGDGPLRPEVELLCGKLGLGDRVRFPGKVSEREVAALMRDADVFVHHSVTARDGDQEGIPTVLMEAMATGLPVLSTEHAGIPELVTDTVTGHLVPERDVDAYVERMRAVLAGDPTEMGRRAAERVRDGFDLATQNAKLVEHYRAAMGVPA